MFEAYVKGRKLNLKRTVHVLLSTSQPSQYSTWDLGFLIDVVHKNYFETFLEKIDGSIISLQETIKRKARKISANIANMEESLPRRRL